MTALQILEKSWKESLKHCRTHKVSEKVIAEIFRPIEDSERTFDHGKIMGRIETFGKEDFLCFKVKMNFFEEFLKTKSRLQFLRDRNYLV